MHGDEATRHTDGEPKGAGRRGDPRGWVDSFEEEAPRPFERKPQDKNLR